MSNYAAQIQLNGKTIPMENVTGFKFVIDIRSMYAGAQVQIRDLCESLFNNIATGMDANVVFGSEDDTYVNRMKVLDFVKVPGNQQDASDAITLNLVSSWYFTNQVGSLAYKGTVSQIMTQVYEELIPNQYVEYDSEDSDDHSTIRYLAGDRFQEFMKRIFKYARKNDSPMYLYSDDHGMLNFRSFSTMGQKNPAVTLIPDTMTMNQDGGNAPYLNTTYLRAVDFSFQSNCKDSASTHNYLFACNNFLGTDDMIGGLQLSNMEADNTQSAETTPERTTYFGWHLTPDDAYSVALHDFLASNMSTYAIVAVFKGICMDMVSLGGTMQVKLPFQPITDANGNQVNLGEGKYVVSHVEYDYEGANYQTKVQLVQYNS